MKHVIITLIAAFALAASGMVVGIIFGMNLAQPRYMPPENVLKTYPTGQEVLVGLNEYRESLDLPPFVLSERLCNNISSRWENYVGKKGHEGLDEFVAKEMPGSQVGEIMVYGETVDSQIKQWSESPSHDILIKKYSNICVYSAEGSSVALLSN